MTLSILIVVGVLVAFFTASLVLSRRSKLARVAGAIIAIGFAAFCAFGFLASFEPMNSPNWPWQIAYGVLGISFIITAILNLKGNLPCHLR